MLGLQPNLPIAPVYRGYLKGKTVIAEQITALRLAMAVFLKFAYQWIAEFSSAMTGLLSGSLLQERA